jgi:drug/metabolite transporter (DMT)-like permease
MLFSFFLLFLFKLNIEGELKRIKFKDFNTYLYLIICLGTMQYTTNYVLNHMAVGYALSLFQLSIIVSVLFGYKFFSEQHVFKKIIGSIIMIAGSILIILFKN